MRVLDASTKCRLLRKGCRSRPSTVTFLSRVLFWKNVRYFYRWFCFLPPVRYTTFSLFTYSHYQNFSFPPLALMHKVRAAAVQRWQSQTNLWYKICLWRDMKIYLFIKASLTSLFHLMEWPLLNFFFTGRHHHLPRLRLFLWFVLVRVANGKHINFYLFSLHIFSFHFETHFPWFFFLFCTLLLKLSHFRIQTQSLANDLLRTKRYST